MKEHAGSLRHAMQTEDISYSAIRLGLHIGQGFAQQPAAATATSMVTVKC